MCRAVWRDTPAPRDALRWYYPLVRALVGEFGCGSHSREVAMRRLRKFRLPLLAVLLTHGFRARAGSCANARPKSRPASRSKSLSESWRELRRYIRRETPRDREGRDGRVRARLARVRPRALRRRPQGFVTASDLQDAHDQLFEIAGAFQSQISQATRTVQGARFTFREASARTSNRIAPDVRRAKPNRRFPHRPRLRPQPRKPRKPPRGTLRTCCIRGSSPT